MIFLQVLIALIIGLFIYVTLAAVIRRFWMGPPAEPDPETLEKVNLEYRCDVCGSQVTMTVAPQGEVLDAPRHCKEDMILVTPIN